MVVYFVEMVNSYGYFYVEVLEWLKECDIKIYGIDVNGMVIIEIDGEKIYV